MGQLFSIFRSNNLERYFNDLYQNRIEIKVTKEEEQFIQNGIETLVDNIICDVSQPIFDIIRQEMEIENGPDSRNEDTFDKTYCVRGNEAVEILSVGSFYERTKNTYPDEFDFIFIVGEIVLPENSENFPVYEYTKPSVMSPKTVEFVVNFLQQEEVHKRLVHTDYMGDRSILFENLDRLTEPAFKLKFLYRDKKKIGFPIYVDLVPAFRVIDPFLSSRVYQECSSNDFAEEVIKTGRYLCVRNRLTFTETEVHFMKYVLSEKHVKVYRILKYIFNGFHGEDVLLRTSMEMNCHVDLKRVTSYDLKTLVILHHYTCDDYKKDEVGYCVLMIILKIIQSYETGMWRNLLTERDLWENKTEFQEIRSFFQNLCANKLTELYLSLFSLKRTSTWYSFEKSHSESFAVTLSRDIRKYQLPDLRGYAMYRLTGFFEVVRSVVRPHVHPRDDPGYKILASMRNYYERHLSNEIDEMSTVVEITRE